MYWQGRASMVDLRRCRTILLCEGHAPFPVGQTVSCTAIGPIAQCRPPLLWPAVRREQVLGQTGLSPLLILA